MQFKFFVLAAICGCAIASPVLESADVNAGVLELEGADVNAGGLKFEGGDANVHGPELKVRATQGDSTSTSGSAQPMESGSAKPDDKGESKSKCGNRKSTVPLVRKNSPKFHVSTDIGLFFRDKQHGTVALFILFNRKTGDYIYTASTRERFIVPSHGYELHGIAGWIYPDEQCGGKPLFRLWNARTKLHFYTVSVSEKEWAEKSGYEFASVTGFIHHK